MLEAQARGHELLYYTPDSLAMRDGRVSARLAPWTVRDVAGDHFTSANSPGSILPKSM
jgi:glutathione synthase